MGNRHEPRSPLAREGCVARDAKPLSNRVAAHRAWLETFAFTELDWFRIKRHALTVAPNYQPAALDDLDAPYRVGACPVTTRRHASGVLLGVYEGRAILAWPQTEEGHRSGPASRW